MTYSSLTGAHICGRLSHTSVVQGYRKGFSGLLTDFHARRFFGISCVLIDCQHTLRNPDTGTFLRIGEVLYR